MVHDVQALFYLRGRIECGNARMLCDREGSHHQVFEGALACSALGTSSGDGSNLLTD